MHALPSRILVILIAIALMAGTEGCGRKGDDVAGDLYYKIETGGAQSGYAVVDTSLVVEDGEELIRLDQRMHFESAVMGTDMDTESRLTYLLEPDTKRVHRFRATSSTGSRTASWTVEITDGRAHGASTLKQDDMTLDLPADAIVENTLFFAHLVADFSGSGRAERTYRVLDAIDFEIRDVQYERYGEETLSLAGEAHPTIAVDRFVIATGTRARMWIDTRTGMLVKVVEQDGNVVTLADRSAVDAVERVDMDKYLFDRTDVAIADVSGITYMKVRAVIRPIGLHATPEMLNVPGQKFTGTVDNNVIDGVFEIEHRRFDGAGAPGFPIDRPAPDLAEYLTADGVYEADDTVLVDQAREITAGATDAWQAATRLASWISDEISYAIPGGGTARNTYDMRAGECGGHSILLATFCRAVGIPARMVWGCMYTPNQGGSFGQHGWTEVHMGAAGWIPVDATVGEIDFVDSGHVRVAHFSSLVSRLNAQEFEILDYRVAGVSPEMTAAARERYAPYIGVYRQRESAADCEVKVMDGGLVVDVPSEALLALDDPDDAGRWVCKLAKHVYATFHRKNADGTGSVDALTLHERYSLPRREAPGAVEGDVSADIVPYLGRYYMAALASDFEISWKNGGLVLRHPRRERDFVLEPAGAAATWKTRNGPYEVSFVTDHDGTVLSMTLDAANEFKKR